MFIFFSLKKKDKGKGQKIWQKTSVSNFSHKFWDTKTRKQKKKNLVDLNDFCIWNTNRLFTNTMVPSVWNLEIKGLKVLKSEFEENW